MAIFDSSDEEEEDKAKEDAKKMKNSPDGSYLRQAAMKALKNRGKIVSLTSFFLDFIVCLLVKPKAASSVKNTAKVAPISPKKQQPAKKAINPSDFFGSTSVAGGKKRSLDEIEAHDDKEFKATLRQLDSSTTNVAVSAAKAAKG
jgi:hypothetical protein